MPSNQGNRFQQPIPKVGHQPKSETNTAPAQNQSLNSSSDKEKPLPVPAHKKNGQGEKSVTGTGGSLKNMWGRLPVKTESDNATIEVKNHDHSGLFSNLSTPVSAFQYFNMWSWQHLFLP